MHGPDTISSPLLATSSHIAELSPPPNHQMDDNNRLDNTTHSHRDDELRLRILPAVSVGAWFLNRRASTNYLVFGTGDTYIVSIYLGDSADDQDQSRGR